MSWQAPDLPLVAPPAPAAVPVDGRQSPAALAVRRGTGRLMRSLGFAVVPELTLPTGQRADLVALGPGGEVWIVEIKSSPADLRADRKWPAYRPFCDRLFFATHPDVPLPLFPAEEGLVVSDGYGAEIVRTGPETKLVAARRKAMTLRFALAAARRLHDLEDPNIVATAAGP